MLFSVMALLALSLVLTGCGNDAPVEQAAEPVVAEPALALEEDAVLEEAVVETAVTPTEEPITDECLACHIDKELLIDTADPIEEVVSENEGEG
jgi:predicted small lipoprotein YifL